MSLTSLLFFLFIIIGVFVYYLGPSRVQWFILLCMSIIFYCSYCLEFPFFLLLSILSVYLLARKIEKESIKKKRKSYLVVGLLFNFGILAFTKYTGFVLDIFKISSGNGIWNSIVIPIGISFYTFQVTGYLLDVYWRKEQAEKNLLKFALFTTYFPQIIQGPISKYKQLGRQLTEKHKFNYNNIKFGLQLILWGYFKKLVVADTAAVAARTVFNDVGNFYGIEVIVGVLCYCAQLYGDFSGGIDVIRGVSQLFGIEMIDNFRQPFCSQSIAEFWRRWHISLGTWMKDYVFYPFSLSKSMTKFGQWARKKLGKQIGRKLPICLGNLLVFFLVGVWHGPSWHFIVYGLYNGFIIAISSLLEPTYGKIYEITGLKKDADYLKWFRVARTFILVNIGWYFDNTKNLIDSFVLMKNTFALSTIDFSGGTYLGLSIFQYAIILIGICIMCIIGIIKEKGLSVRMEIAKLPILIRWAIWICLIYAIPMLGYFSQSAGGFMYAQF